LSDLLSTTERCNGAKETVMNTDKKYGEIIWTGLSGIKYDDPKKIKPYDFPRGTKLALWVLVQLYEAGYTSVPFFDKLQVIESFDIYDQDLTGGGVTYLATNYSGDYKVQICMFGYGMSWEYEVTSIVIWRGVLKGEGFTHDYLFRDEYLAVLSGNKLAPVLRKFPKKDDEEYPVWGGHLKIFTEGKPEEKYPSVPDDKWTQVGVLVGEWKAPYARDHLSQIWEMIGAFDSFVGSDVTRINEKYQIGFRPSDGTVWVMLRPS
jgi:hypothetical protein